MWDLKRQLIVENISDIGMILITANVFVRIDT